MDFNDLELPEPGMLLSGKGQHFKAVVEYEVVEGKVNVLKSYVQYVKNVEKKRKAPVVVEREEAIEL